MAKIKMILLGAWRRFLGQRRRFLAVGGAVLSILGLSSLGYASLMWHWPTPLVVGPIIVLVLARAFSPRYYRVSATAAMDGDDAAGMVRDDGLILSVMVAGLAFLCWFGVIQSHRVPGLAIAVPPGLRTITWLSLGAALVFLCPGPGLAVARTIHGTLARVPAGFRAVGAVTRSLPGWFRWFFVAHSPVIGLVLTAGLTVFLIGFGETIAFGGGMGWDGSHRFVVIMEHFPGVLFDRSLASYDFDRILPYALVGSLLQLADAPLSRENVVLSFKVLNGLELLFVCACWGRLARILGVSLGGYWTGLTGLLLSGFVCKWIFYCAPLSDMSAFAIGFVMALFYLERRLAALIAVTFVSGFIWPTAPFIGALLIAFPRYPDRLPGTPPDQAILVGRLAMAAGVLAALAAAVAVIKVFSDQVVPLPPPCDLCHQHIPAWDTLPSVLMNLASLLAVCAAAFCFTYFPLVRFPLSGLRATPLKSLMVTMGCAVSTWAAGKMAMARLSDTAAFYPDGLFLLNNLLDTAAQKPALFVVAHLVFFGPLVVLVMLSFGAFGRLVSATGLGLTLAAGLALFLGLDSESRRSVHSFGLLFPFFVAAIDIHLRTLSPRRIAVLSTVFAGLSFLWSRLWFQIGADIPTYSEVFGPGMRWEAYWPFTCSALLTGIVLMWLFCGRASLVRLARRLP